MGTLKLYGDLASWWPLLSAPADYAEEAAFFERHSPASPFRGQAATGAARKTWLGW